MRHRITADGKLSQRLRRHAAETVPIARHRLAQQLRDEAARDLASRSPVRTGRLAQGWQSAGQGGGPDGAAGQSDSVGQTVATATNLTPYVGYVEYGTSKQPPQRLAGAAIRRVARLAGQLFRLTPS